VANAHNKSLSEHPSAPPKIDIAQNIKNLYFNNIKYMQLN